LSSFLLRHASAVDPRAWEGLAQERPLDPAGLERAAAIAELLRAGGARRVVSSPYRRCVQTVEPLAASLGVPVELDSRLAEGSGRSGLELFDEDGVVACTHGDVIGELLGHGLAPGEFVSFGRS
jgi:8-oxo-dGTP diphosphatase